MSTITHFLLFSSPINLTTDDLSIKSLVKIWVFTPEAESCHMQKHFGGPQIFPNQVHPITPQEHIIVGQYKGEVKVFKFT